MKKVIMFCVAAFIMLLLAPVQVNAASDKSPDGDQLSVPPEVGLMIARLEEIRDMDVSMLANAEKRDLRREVRDIENDLKAYNGGGLYISLGAAILIILLLILLL
ncbi:MAG: hypothetical protein R6V49_03595 [Bacteroidales bacterium]